MRTYRPRASTVRLGARTQNDVVTIGSTVVVRDLDSNEVESYRIVDATQADITNNWISTLTPAGRAFYGRRAGDVVAVEAPGGTFHFRIESVACDGCMEHRTQDENDAGDSTAFSELETTTA